MNKACGWHSHLATQCRCLNQVKAEGIISRTPSCLSALVVFLNDMFSSGRWEQALKNNFFWRQTNWLPGNACVFRNLGALGVGWWCPAHLTMWPLQAMPVPSPPLALSVTHVALRPQYKTSVPPARGFYQNWALGLVSWQQKAAAGKVFEHGSSA